MADIEERARAIVYAAGDGAAFFGEMRDDLVDRVAAALREARQDGSLFVEGEFTAHSGATLHEKIECDALTEADWYCLARMIHRRLAGRYLEAIGVPRGGVLLAQKLNALSRADQDTLGPRPTLIVDDVLTSGSSLREHLGEGRIGFVVFDRSGGKNLPPNCRALFTLDAVVGSFPHSNATRKSST